MSSNAPPGNPEHSLTRLLSEEFNEKRAKAEATLWAEMAQLGLRAEDGWSIAEFTRDAAGGTELVLRPLHRKLPSPLGLECVVGIVEATGDIQSVCTGPKLDL